MRALKSSVIAIDHTPSAESCTGTIHKIGIGIVIVKL